MAEARKTVFVSYAREDRRWANELLTFLAPWIREKRVNLWDDSRIQPGASWRAEIESAIEEATVAVLLVSKAFFASDFISEYELPILVERARTRQMRLAWVAVGYSAVEATPLWQFQAVKRKFEPAQDRISFRGAYQSIAVDDLTRLPEADREFIADLEDSLVRNYKRWSAVRKGLGDAGGTLDGEVENQLTRIAKLMCRDLNAILGFLREMHKAELEDHYARYRYICERLNAA